MDNIYADSDTSITDVDQIIDVFNNPDHGLDDGNSEEARIGFECGTVQNSKFLEDLCDNLLSLAHLEYFLNKLSSNMMII